MPHIVTLNACEEQTSGRLPATPKALAKDGDGPASSSVPDDGEIERPDGLDAGSARPQLRSRIQRQ